MKLRMYYRIEDYDEGRTRIAEICNRRIRTRADVEKMEKLIASKIGVNKVRIFNWKVVGTLSERFGRPDKHIWKNF